jgi:uncharacterized membrane protein
VGLYAALFMLRKSVQAERGALAGPSVVREPHARLFFGLPNAFFGSLYFPFVAAGVWFSPPGLRWFVIALVAAAAATSLFLAYSLLFVTKRECPYCWTSHAVNVLLLVLVPWALSG